MVKDIILSLVILFSLIGCSPRLTPTPLATSPAEDRIVEIEEPSIGEPYTVFVEQIVRSNNCDGANPMIRVSRSLAQEQTTNFDVQVEAGGLIRGAPIPEVLQIELEAALRSSIGKTVSTNYQNMTEFTLQIQPGVAMENIIIWKETRVKGIINVVFENGTSSVSFERVIGIESYDRKSEIFVCPSVLPSPTSTVIPIIATLGKRPSDDCGSCNCVTTEWQNEFGEQCSETVCADLCGNTCGVGGGGCDGPPLPNSSP